MSGCESLWFDFTVIEENERKAVCWRCRSLLKCLKSRGSCVVLSKYLRCRFFFREGRLLYRR